jgi:hypothetical protein
VETLIAMLAFLALVASWFVLPATPRTIAETTASSVSEGLATAA